MTLDNISTEVLLKLRERFQSGRTRFHAMVASVEWMQEWEREIIEALESELRRRLN
jgi:hypothetical protein